MRGKLNCIVLFFVCVAVSCTRKDGKQIVQHFRRVEGLYHTNDIRVAEKALLEHRDDLIKNRAKQLEGIDYDTSLAIANGRLFLIYEQLGDSNKAQRFFEESAQSLNNRRRKQGVQLENFTPEALEAKITLWDSAAPPAWRTNDRNH